MVQMFGTDFDYRGERIPNCFTLKDPQNPEMYEKFPGGIGDVILTDEAREKVLKIIEENRCREKLTKLNLLPRKRILFHGSPGTGKTFCAMAIAAELEKRLFIFNLESLAGSLDQSQSSELNTISEAFDFLIKNDAVFLFDEFDAIAQNRMSLSSGPQNPRRLVNFLLTNMETSATLSHSLIICTTNLLSCIDGAFRRRFDTIVEFHPPSLEERRAILNSILKTYQIPAKTIEVEAFLDATTDLSLHEVKTLISNAVKSAILSNQNLLNLKDEIRSALLIKESFKI